MFDALPLSGDPLSAFATLTVAGLLMVGGASGGSYLVFFVVGRQWLNPDYRPDWRENRRAIGWSIASVLGNAAFTAPLHFMIAIGWSGIYDDVGAWPLWWIPVSVLLTLGVTETLIYWTHRALHSPGLFKRFHRQHHSFRRPTSWVAFAFHPVDSFAQALPYHLCALLVPMHLWVYLGLLGFVSLWSVAIHDRVTLFRVPGLNYTDHHTVHHLYNRHNYGQFTTVWDRLMGTWRQPEVQPLLLRLERERTEARDRARRPSRSERPKDPPAPDTQGAWGSHDRDAARSGAGRTRRRGS